MKILLLEDDVMIASGVKYALENEGYEVAHAKDVAAAKSLISSSRDFPSGSAEPTR